MSDQTNPEAPVAADDVSAGGNVADWARLDTAAVTPRARADMRAVTTRPARLRRSRSQVLGALDGGGTMLQRRGRDVLVGSSLLLVPLVALNLWATTLAFDRNGSTTLTAFGGDEVGTGIEDVAVVLAVVFASFAASLVGVLAATILIADRFGTSVTLRRAMTLTVRRTPAALVAWACGHFWVPFLATWTMSSRSSQLGARLVLVAPVAAAAATITVFVIPVMVAERTGPFRALRRSMRLVRLRFGSALGFIVSSFVIGGLLLAGVTLLPTLAEQAGFITFGGYGWLTQGLAGQFGVIIVTPLIALATAEMYLQVRLDAEGMDIVLDADFAFGRRERPA